MDTFPSLRQAVCLLTTLVALGVSPLRSAHAQVDYAPVVLKAHVIDRLGRPVTGLRVRFDANLSGFATHQLGSASGSEPLALHDIRTTAVTDAGGVATAFIRSPAMTTREATEPWFRGHVEARAVPDDPKRTESVLDYVPGGQPTLAGFDLPAAPGESGALDLPIHTFEDPDSVADDFPIWTARSGRRDKIVVVLEGFDLYNDYAESDVMRLLGGAGDALRASGISLLVVNYPDSHLRPDRLAPLAARAIRAASEASGGRQIAVVGLSMGGVVARWTLCQAEKEGAPLPVHSLLLLDSPNRGANIPAGLQAMILRYGSGDDRAAMRSDAAGALMMCRPADVRWRTVGVPLADRKVPTAWTEDPTEHDAFYNALRGLNSHNGYPTTCHVAAVANSLRSSVPDHDGLLHLWLPYGQAWTLPASPADHAPGSLLPIRYADRLKVFFPMGLAGSYLRSRPTFVSAESALDAAPGETPPFDTWYAEPDNAPLHGHDEVDAGAATFAVRFLLSAPWEKTMPAKTASSR